MPGTARNARHRRAGARGRAGCAELHDIGASTATAGESCLGEQRRRVRGAQPRRPDRRPGRCRIRTRRYERRIRRLRHAGNIANRQPKRASARAHPHGLAQRKRFIAEHRLCTQTATSNAAACGTSSRAMGSRSRNLRRSCTVGHHPHEHRCRISKGPQPIFSSRTTR